MTTKAVKAAVEMSRQKSESLVSDILRQAIISMLLERYYVKKPNIKDRLDYHYQTADGIIELITTELRQALTP